VYGTARGLVTLEFSNPGLVMFRPGLVVSGPHRVPD